MRSRLMHWIAPSEKVTDNAAATHVSAKATLAKPSRRSIGETKLHPLFNMSDWVGENLRQDVRWKFWMPLHNVLQNAA